MKHILYLLIIIFQSCCAMNPQQITEGDFRQKVTHYLSLPNIETSTYPSDEEKRYFYQIVSHNRPHVPQEEMQDVRQKVEFYAKKYGMLDTLYAIVLLTNKFASKTSNTLAENVLDQEINKILRPNWINSHGINHKSEGSNIDIIIAGLQKTKKDMEAGIQPKLEITKQELLCHLLLAYGGSSNAAAMIYLALPCDIIIIVD